MTVDKYEDTDSGQPVFGFRVMDKTGKQVEGGRGFVIKQHRDDAIPLALKRLCKGAVA